MRNLLDTMKELEHSIELARENKRIIMNNLDKNPEDLYALRFIDKALDSMYLKHEQLFEDFITALEKTNG
jgi:hypothetical protein